MIQNRTNSLHKPIMPKIPKIFTFLILLLPSLGSARRLKNVTQQGVTQIRTHAKRSDPSVTPSNPSQKLREAKSKFFYISLTPSHEAEPAFESEFFGKFGAQNFSAVARPKRYNSKITGEKGEDGEKNGRKCFGKYVVWKCAGDDIKGITIHERKRL